VLRWESDLAKYSQAGGWFLPQIQSIFVANLMGKHSGSVDSRVLQRIQAMKPGAVFAPTDLAALGPRTAVASALSRYLKAGLVKRPARGLYQVPEAHPLFGELQASPDRFAQALAGKGRLKLQPSGAYAANLLGLSEQVPLRIVYLTDGTPRQICVGRQQIVLRRTTPRNMATAGRTSGLVIQALRHLGKEHANNRVVEMLRRRLAPKDREQLLEDLPLAPAWIAQIMKAIAEGTSA
jgi:hypothetical protein